MRNPFRKLQWYDLEDRMKILLKMAKKHGWVLIADKGVMISFRKNGTRINIYWTKMTVGTCLNHPTKGKTQLFRRNVDKEEMNFLFKNPRKHTGKGYYQK